MPCQSAGLSVRPRAGTVDGGALCAKGLLLEHKLASISLSDAKASARVRVKLDAVLDWVVDYSEPASVWIITDAAWYRCAWRCSEGGTSGLGAGDKQKRDAAGLVHLEPTRGSAVF
jgi:hypothetical protein